jgi:hypothetical protein
VADAAKAAVAGCRKRFEHGLRRIAQRQVGVADDRGAGAQIAINATGTLRGDAVDEFHFATGRKSAGVGAIERAAFHIDGAYHAMPALRIGAQMIEHVERESAAAWMNG